jgi:hypothetical protein
MSAHNTLQHNTMKQIRENTTVLVFRATASAILFKAAVMIKATDCLELI